MSTLAVGAVVLAVGLLLVVSGASTARILMSLWAGLAGFWVAATVAATVTGRAALTDPVGWVAAILGAVIAAATVYAVYALAVVIGAGTLGYVLGVAGATAAGASGGRTPLTVGLVCGAVAIVLAAVMNLPRLLLVALTVLGGAAAVVLGLMFLTGSLTTVHPDQTAITRALDIEPRWRAVYLAVCAVGAVVQLARRRSGRRMRRSWPGRPVHA